MSLKDSWAVYGIRQDGTAWRVYLDPMSEDTARATAKYLNDSYPHMVQVGQVTFEAHEYNWLPDLIRSDIN
jgi:hypothetical protein